jgi:hypothetical protein
MEKYLSYNLSIDGTQSNNANFFSNLPEFTSDSSKIDLDNSARLKDLVSNHASLVNLTLSNLDSPNLDKNTVNSTADGKFTSNTLRSLLASFSSRKNVFNSPIIPQSDLLINVPTSQVYATLINNSSSSKFKELKSPNMGFLSTDKNSRLISKLHSSKGQYNFSHKNNNLQDIISSIADNNTSPNELNSYNFSNSSWASNSVVNKLTSLNSVTGGLNSPIYSNDPT